MVELEFPAEMNSSENGYEVSSDAVLTAFKDSRYAESRAGAIEWWEKNIPSSDQKTITIPKTACVRI